MNNKEKITITVEQTATAATKPCHGYVVRRVMPRNDTERIFGLARSRREVGFTWIASLNPLCSWTVAVTVLPDYVVCLHNYHKI